MKSKLIIENQKIANEAVSLTCGAEGISEICCMGQNILGAGGIRISAFEDNSDTWSHGIFSYDGPLAETFRAEEPWSVLEGGPIRDPCTTFSMAKAAGFNGPCGSWMENGRCNSA